jgi:hypothetical protein
MKNLTGAQVIALGGDAAALEAGQDNSAGGFRGMVAVHVDRVIKDGDGAILGSAVVISQTGSVEAYNPAHLSYTFDRDLPGNFGGSVMYTGT